MAQIKIYGNANHLEDKKRQISDTLHGCIVEALGLPPEKRFHRFIPLAGDDFIYPSDRSEKYTIIEIEMLAGRKKETKKALIRRIFPSFEANLEIEPQDVEITIHERPKENGGIRGLPGGKRPLFYI